MANNLKNPIVISDSDEEGNRVTRQVRRLVRTDTATVAAGVTEPDTPRPDGNRRKQKQPRRAEEIVFPPLNPDGPARPAKKQKTAKKVVRKTEAGFRAWCFTHFRQLPTTPGVPNAEDRFVERLTDTSLGVFGGTGHMLSHFYQIDDCTGMVVGDEICPTTGKSHFQGCWVFKNLKKFATIKQYFCRIFGNEAGNTTHFEPCRGNSEENSAYCTKERTIVNDLPAFGQGKRNDWTRFRDAILAGLSDHQLNMLFPQKCAQHTGYIKWCRLAHQKETVQPLPEGTRKTMGIWLKGPTGIGKSSMLPHKGYWLNGKWWDSYHADDELIIIDDPIPGFSRYYAGELKRLVVEHPVLVEPKGGMICMRPKQFIVLSNDTMRDYFGGDITNALITRFTQVTCDTREELQRFYAGWTHVGQDLTNWCDVTKQYITDVSATSAPAANTLPDTQIELADFFRPAAGSADSGSTVVSPPNTGQ